MNEYLKQIVQIDSAKHCLKFLANRLQSANYRGVQISQHNRYTKEEILIILQEIHHLCGKNLMQIRTTDLSKRAYNTEDEELYAQLTHNIASKMGRCTQDSLRKNIFVDLHRMNLLQRFDKKQKSVSPFTKGIKKYIALSKEGIELLLAQDIFTQNLLYTRALENLLNGFGEEILSLALELDSHFVDMYEILFFATFMYQNINDIFYTRSDIVSFIKEYRMLSKFSKNVLKEYVKNYCNPNNFTGDKTQKRDFHNWLNETQQILSILTQMMYFEYNKQDQRLYIRTGKDGVFEDNAKLKRSLKQKQEYFTQHNISKTKGFELHHIVPLCFAKSKAEFHTIDDWRNLAYIDAFSHAQITQNNNANMRLSFNNEPAIFSDFIGTKVRCDRQTHIKYDVRKQGIMLQYNGRLLDSRD